MADNLYQIEARIRRYERQAAMRDRIVFYGVLIVSAIALALGGW